MAAPNSWDRFLAAIRAQESGGNYQENVPGCEGAYCWSGQGTWDEMARSAGLGHYAGQSPASVPPKIQDQVASANLHRIYQQTHSLAAAARWWNGGTTESVPNPGLPAQSWAKDCGGGSSGAYACQVLRRMSLGGHYLSGHGSGSGGTVTTSATADCFAGFGGIPGTSWINDIFGSGGNVGNVCLVTYSQARAFVGVSFLLGGALIALPGIALIALGVGMRATSPVLATVNGIPVAGTYTQAATAALSRKLSYTPPPKAKGKSGAGSGGP